MGKILALIVFVVGGSIVPGGIPGAWQATIPPEAYLNPVDREIARTGVGRPGRPYPCTHKVKWRGASVVESLPTDKCVRMEPARLWRGLWLNEFEGSQFCPAPAKTCAPQSRGDHIWLTEGPLKGQNGALYEVSFIGRRTMYRGSYGHMGVFEREIIVDKLVSIRRVR